MVFSFQCSVLSRSAVSSSTNLPGDGSSDCQLADWWKWVRIGFGPGSQSFFSISWWLRSSQNRPSSLLLLTARGAYSPFGRGPATSIATTFGKSGPYAATAANDSLTRATGLDA